MSFSVEEVRKDFPIFKREINGHSLVYLDNAATTLKPKQVVDVISEHYLMGTSNVHRGIHTLSAQATDAYEEARKTLASYINSPSEKNIVFTTGTTASINLVAQSYATNFLKAGDEIVITELEHHSNIVPWQMACEKNSAILKVVPILEDGSVDFEAFKDIVTSNTKLISMNYVSNSIGVINPVEEVIALAKSVGAKVCIDAAQAAAHMAIDVQALDCDFLALSSHKMCGPTGMGLLYGKEELLEMMPPLNGGGDMIKEVRFEKSTWNDVPFKFEAGTPHIAGVIGFAAAAKYIQSLGFENIQKQEEHLYELAKKELEEIEGLVFFGTSKKKVALFAFGFPGVHPSDLGTIMDQYGVAVRTGHHCTQPLMELFKVPGTTRASFAFYNNDDDVYRLKAAILKAKEFLL
ncbi:MAG: cysteine desulfurase CsdA [Bdellovibrionaceae bacterium]|nr:cysteine desulfurase CsdA [Pseudobdellovibrionaceae bacterium]|tara:strand:+ start:54413 stop:55633 length:1221 start_codon:yes stop_codon:yes gene_type:complete